MQKAELSECGWPRGATASQQSQLWLSGYHQENHIIPDTAFGNKTGRQTRQHPKKLRLLL